METGQGQPPHQLRCNGCSSCCSISRKRLVAAGYALLAIGSRVGFFIITPIWLDYFNPINSTSLGNLTHEEEYDLELASNVSNNSSTSCPRSSNPYFAALGQWTFSTLILGFGLLLIRLFSPRRIRDDVERSYPKRQFAIMGLSQGVSTMFTAFAISGSRTPPYIQSILSSFALPAQFVVRFIILRKRPGLVKAICAVVVTLSSVVCLIPTIFPSLESKKQHRQEGGSTGVDRFLWPAFFIAAQIPFAVTNSLMERSVQSEQKATTNSSPDIFANNNSSSIDHDNNGNENNGINNSELSSSCDGRSTAVQQQQQQQQQQQDAPHLQLDLIYFNFWWTLFVVATLVSLFWVDILPVIGTSSSLADFGCKMWFNLQCLFGAADCIGVIALLGWLDFCTVLFGNFAFAGLMRHSEGANFVMIVMMIRTPIIFIFWTLFVEQPFSWQPHASLGTWLSIGAIVVMVAAIVLYDRAPSEVVPDSERRRRDEERISDDDDDRQSLIGSQPSSAAVDDDYDTSYHDDASSSNHIRHIHSDQRS